MTSQKVYVTTPATNVNVEIPSKFETFYILLESRS